MKSAVFIDGGNLYRRLKDLDVKNTSQFDYKELIQFLTKQKIDEVSYIGYYVGQIRKERGNPKSQELYAKQQRLFAYLQNTIPNLQIIRGHIQNFKGIYQEKGVDVRIALDIYKHGIKNTYDKAVLISSDTDLIPAVRMVQSLGKNVEYIGFAHKPSFALLKECKQKRLLTKDDLTSLTKSN